jgi:enoyl-CoA hydratase/carnithine racemase
MVRLLGALESGQETRVVVLESADPEYFVPHVDLTKVAEYTAEAATAGGPDDASLGTWWHKLSELPVVSIAKIAAVPCGGGQRTGAGVRHAVRRAGERHPGTDRGRRRHDPGARAACSTWARLLGRRRALEAILGADDFGAEQAERYGWINRTLPDADLDAFAARLARRIASFPADAVRSAKRVVNELTQPCADAIRADARRFRQLVASDTAKAAARPPCSRRACRPVARSNSTSATASEPFDRETDPTHR